MWDLQLSNWLLSFAGAGATYVALIVCLAFVLAIFLQFKKITKSNTNNATTASYTALVTSILLFGFVLIAMFSFQSNAPKNTLGVKENETQLETKKELPALKNLEPEKLTPEESSKRLEELRKKQKEDTSLGKEDNN